MGRVKKLSFEEEKVEWNKSLNELITSVSKSYDKSCEKGKYDLLIALEIAQRCIK